MSKDFCSVSPRGESILLFSYGANMARKTLLKRNLNPISCHPARILDDRIAISFQHRAAFATLVKTKEPVDTKLCVSKPYGIVNRMTYDDFRKIQKREIGYKICSLNNVCLLNTGEMVDCVVFVSSSWLLLSQPMPPTHRYKDLLVSGCVENRLDKYGGSAYMEWLQKVPSVELKEVSSLRYSQTPSEKAARAFGVFCMLCITASTIFFT